MPRRPWYRDPTTVATTVLAAARLTRLATRDTWPPAATARRAATAYLDARAPAWTPVLHCDWCASPWIAAALIAAVDAADRRGHGRAAALALLPLAASHVAGTLADWEPA